MYSFENTKICTLFLESILQFVSRPVNIAETCELYQAKRCS